ncbi:MAG TPA: lipopolysaccharide kinase InaA family protein [Myxococcota bacterium]
MVESAAVAVEVERYRAAGFDWKVRRGFRPGVDALCRALDDPGRLEGGVCVKANAARSVWRVALAGRTVYVKRYHVRGWRERLKYRIVPPRAEAEWRAAVGLGEAGIEAVEPLAVGLAHRDGWLTDAFFVAAEAPGVPYSEFLAALRGDAEAVEALLRATVALHERLRAAGVFHPDLHGGNMLGRLEGGEPRIALVDLHSIHRRRRVGRRARRRMRAKLAHSLWRTLREDEFEYALRLLAPADAVRLRLQVERLERARLRSRSRRCMLHSSGFTHERAGDWKIWRRREVAADALLALVARAPGDGNHTARLATGDALRDVSVWRSTRRDWLPVWKGCHALGVRGIPTWHAYACMRRRRFGLLREAILVVEREPGAVWFNFAVPVVREAALQRAALDTAERLHRVGLAARPDELFAVREESGWRVLRRAFRGAIPDRPVRAGRARRERERLRALTAPDQSATAER